MDAKLVKKAREEEMREISKHNVYEKADIGDVGIVQGKSQSALGG